MDFYEQFYLYMLFKLMILFILVPLGELALLIEIGKQIGTWPTVAIVVVTGIIGSWMLKWQGISTWRKFRESFNRGGFPGNMILEGLLILIGGAFLLTPGIITDACGFILLIPPSRMLVLKALKVYLKKRFDFEDLIVIEPDSEPGESVKYDPDKRI